MPPAKGIPPTVQQIDLDARRRVAEEHDCRGRPRPHGRQPAGNELACPLGERGWQRPRGRHRSADLHDQLYLDRCVQRQDGDADRAAGMLPAVAEYLAQQLARPVDDLWLAGERRH